MTPQIIATAVWYYFCFTVLQICPLMICLFTYLPLLTQRAPQLDRTDRYLVAHCQWDHQWSSCSGCHRSWRRQPPKTSPSFFLPFLDFSLKSRTAQLRHSPHVGANHVSLRSDTGADTASCSTQRHTVGPVNYMRPPASQPRQVSTRWRIWCE